MGNFFITFFICFAVMALTAGVFGWWVLVCIFRFVVRLLMGKPSRPIEQVGVGPTCGNEQCRATNPPGARFCRRCGRAFAPAQPVAVRRAG
jgi:hypothetical protein